ncbi:MAG: efflux RND transporter periplasmic adaptor subunit [Chromatiales bacterium]|nr:efflux RND transporter periplasmic adaptor subunit [Chromatiales bacterium]
MSASKRECSNFGLVTVVLAGCLALAACGKKAPPSLPALDIPVTSVEVTDVPIYLEMVGQTMGSVEIPIRTRVDGVLEGMHFVEGSQVKKGAPLYSIDPRPLQSMVVEAQGRVAEARTALAKASSDLARIAPLAKMNAVSQQDLDGAQAQFEAAKGGLQAAEAQLERANIELGYTEISSPIDGLIGISEAKVGEYVGRSPNPVVLNKVSRIDPIRVRFSINEREYLKFRRRMNGVITEHGPDTNERAELTLVLADGSVHEQTGQVVTSNAAIDPTTGTLTLEADFPNPRQLVLAGQFARLRGILETRSNVILIPQKAIRESQGLFEVAVIGKDGAVELRRVEVGPRTGKFQIIEKGLEAGEQVALEGLQRLRNGMTVNPVAASANGSKED